MDKNFDYILNMDCLEGLRGMENDSVSISFFDPPYNVGKKYDGYSDKRPDYDEWMSSVIGEVSRVSRNGFLVYVGGTLTSKYFKILESYNPHLIIVHKKAAGVFAGGYMLQYHSLFSCAKPVKKCKDLWDWIRLPGEGYFFRETRYDSPGLTSLQMTEQILEYFTSVGDVVLDPFMGTGTTAEACIRTGRHYIGFEQSNYYTQIANERIASVMEEVLVANSNKFLTNK